MHIVYVMTSDNDKNILLGGQCLRIFFRNLSLLILRDVEKPLQIRSTRFWSNYLCILLICAN